MAKKPNNSIEDIQQMMLDKYKPETMDELQDAMKDVFGSMFEAMLQGEMTSHLGFESNDHNSDKKTTNRRNGSGKKKIITKFGEVPINTPRDREGTFDSKLIPKRTRNVSEYEDKVISMYAKGMSQRDIATTIKDIYALPLLLEKLEFAKSSYYYQVKTSKTDKYANFRDLLATFFHDNNDCYGYRRMHSILKKSGYIISEKVVRRLMKEENLVVYKAKKKKYSSYKGEISLEVKNIIERNFHSDAPNTKWLTDITEFSHPEGKVYLSPIIDCFDGKVVSWTVGTSPNADLVNSMLTKAAMNLSETEHPIVHSDRGCHYRWPGWIALMDDFELTRSMSKKGCSPDNSACEGFFGRMKNEFYYGKVWTKVSLKEFIVLINNYIHWYNEKRIKESLGYMSPVEYRESLGIIS
jgi:transposase InsO family protein